MHNKGGEGMRITRVHHTHIWSCQRTALIKIIIKQCTNTNAIITLLSKLSYPRNGTNQTELKKM